MIFTYIARSDLITGHVAGEQYAVQVLATECNRETKIEREIVRSLSGASVTTVKHRYRTWSIRTIAIDKDKTAAMMEFISSVLGGESFTFDEAATVIDGSGDAVPVTPRECELLDQQVRPVPVGQGRYRWTIEFSIREIDEPINGVMY